MPTDPVCDMQIDENEAVATTEFQGTTYYFCADRCKEEFESNPAAYV